MNELSLFTGAGGGLLASRLLGWRTVCAVEIDKYCQRVLLQRQRDGCLDVSPIWDDVRTFDGTEWRGRVDIVTAGFPCQPFSSAGKQLGAADERNLWPDTARILGEVRPRYALLENVPGLLVSGYFGTVLGDLAEMGFDARWGVFSAAGVGAPHIRKRLWVVANSESIGRGDGIAEDIGEVGGESYALGDGSSLLANAEIQRLQRGRHEFGDNSKAPSGGEGEFVRSDCEQHAGWWEVEPDVGRVANGVDHRVDRLRAIGNGQVPAVVVRAWHELSGGLR